MNVTLKLKPNLSIAKIGVLRFWIGLVIGFLFSLCLCLFFNYSREIMRFLSGAFSDLILIDEKTNLFFNIFFAAFSTAIGFSITFWFWMSGTKNEYRKQRLFKRLSQVNSTLIIWIPLMLITRIGFILFILLYAQRGYDSNLKLIEDFQLLFVLLPIVIFLQNWLSIRSIFKTNKWITFSFVAYVAVSMIIHLLASLSNNVVDKNYALRFQEDYQIIESELKRAKEKYNIYFTDTTIKALKQWHTDSSKKQMDQVQRAFESDKSVSIDTIILQKIIIKNFKEGRWDSRQMNSYNNWPYAKPIEIKTQILRNKSDSIKLYELNSLLNEQINLINFIGKKDVDFEQLSQTERRKTFGAKYKIPKVVVDQLINVTDELNNNPELENRKIKLNEINLLNEEL